MPRSANSRISSIDEERVMGSIRQESRTHRPREKLAGRESAARQGHRVVEARPRRHLGRRPRRHLPTSFVLHLATRPACWPTR
jgi:predicted transposase YdaD